MFRKAGCIIVDTLLRYVVEPLLPPARPLNMVRVLRITTTRQCWMQCAFCDFSQYAPLVRHHTASPAISPDHVQQAVSAASYDLIKVRGGLTVWEPWSYFVQLVRHISSQSRAPIQAFSAVELMHFHRVEKIPLRDMLDELRWAGATSLGPGGGELLVDEWRETVAVHRLRSAEWLSIQQLAMESGLQSRAMLLVFHGITPELIQSHLHALQAIRDLSVIEIKPLRTASSPMAYWDPPHLLELLAVVQAIRTQWPHVDIVMNRTLLSEDALTLLHHHGVNHVYITAKEIG